jgi:hypothetical protein
MLIPHIEPILDIKLFQGTILDIETCGDFLTSFPNWDIRRYQALQQVILGHITQSTITIYCARNQDEIEELKALTPEILNSLQRPWYAFNCSFEERVWECQGLKIKFDGELQVRNVSYESKAQAVEGLNIPQYDDPFDDNGLLCAKAWLQNDFKNALAHNRSCLLKERDLLCLRGAQGQAQKGIDKMP